jgi:hypothetical protein
MKNVSIQKNRMQMRNRKIFQRELLGAKEKIGKDETEPEDNGR